MKILIVEDDLFIANYIKIVLEEAGFETIEMATEVETARIAFQNFCPELILMDINLLGKQDGIILATEKNENAGVIFLTGQLDKNTIEKALNLKPESYLTKPFKKLDLINAIHLYQNKKQINTISIKNGHDWIQLAQESILYVKSENIYLDVHTTNKVITIRMTLEKFYQLLQPQLFCKPHRSFIVKKSAVTRITRTHLYVNNVEIPVSRNFEWMPIL